MSRTIFFLALVLTVVGIFAFSSDPDRGLPRDQLPARRDRRRQRRHACRTDAGHHHQADRRRSRFVPGLTTVRSQYKPRFRGGEPLLRLVGGHVPHPGTSQLRPQPMCPAGTTAHRRRSPPTVLPSRRFRSSDTALTRRPFFRQSRLAEVTSGNWPPTTLKPPLNRVNGVSYCDDPGRSDT